MAVEQWVGTTLAFAVVLAVVNLLAGGTSVIARRPLRGGPRRRHRVDDARAAWRALTTRRREVRAEPRGLRRLTGAERARYVATWTHLQRRATALPATTLLDADELLAHLLDDLGYPTEGFVQYAAALSAAHAAVVDDYRVARNIVLDTRLGLAGTPQIRHALLRYVAVFECLAETNVTRRVDEAAA